MTMLKNPKGLFLITILLMTVQYTYSLEYVESEEDPISGSSDAENQFWTYVNDNAPWIAAIVLAAGLFLCGFGHHFFSITLFIVTFYFVFEIVIIFTDEVILNNSGCSSDFCFWMTVGSAAALGFIGGCIAFQIMTVGLLVLGSCGGWYLGVLTCATFHIQTQWVYYLFIGVFVLAGALIACKFKNMIGIVATSFLGAYMVVRAIGYWAGGFPNFYNIEQTYKQWPWQFYVYLSGIILLTILSIIYQTKTKKDKKDPTDYERQE